jgi:hypothetical protein
MPDPQLTTLLAFIDQAFDHKSWHGTNLRGSIRNVSADVAAWRPGPGRHNIWEIVVHAAYWKYVVRRRFRAEARGSFPVKGSNWFVRPAGAAPLEDAWRSDVRLLLEAHEFLREEVSRLTPAALGSTPEGSKVSNVSLISGIAAHDLYHAGQIQLLKRLQKTPS